MTGLIVTTLTFFSTTCGGLVALRFRDRLHLILGFTAGVIIGVVFFDLLPESLELAAQTLLPSSTIMSGVVIGFLCFHILEKLIVLRARRSESEQDVAHQYIGILGAGGFAIHSYLDGLAIGLSFQISTEIGVLVAIAVLAHDFSDGFNTVTVLLRHNASRSTTFRWLLIDAITPLLGATTALSFSLPPLELAIILSVFAGTFLYIGSSDLLPEAHHGHSSALTMLLTILGALFIYSIVQILG